LADVQEKSESHVSKFNYVLFVSTVSGITVQIELGCLTGSHNY